MKLIYCYINKYKNIKKQEVVFSHEYSVKIDNNGLHVSPNPSDSVTSSLINNRNLQNFHIVVGKTGSGKTNLLQLIGMNFPNRLSVESETSYCLIYHKQNNEYAIELINFPLKYLEGNQLRSLNGGACSYSFFTDESNNAYRFSELNDTTVIFNGYDRNSFSNPIYSEKRNQQYDVNPFFLSRVNAPYQNADLFFVCKYLKKYIDSFSGDSIKKNTSLIIHSQNWSKDMDDFLPEQLINQDYYSYKKHYLSENLDNPDDSKNIISKKECFINDLMVDFALYLRGTIARNESFLQNNPSIAADESKSRKTKRIRIGKSFFVQPGTLPDYKEMPIELRILWLAAYIDNRTGKDTSTPLLRTAKCINQISNTLKKYNQKYFTSDTFTLPISEMFSNENNPLTDKLFLNMEQYDIPSDAGLFETELLPYKLTCISSGEHQLARIFGSIEKSCFDVQVGNKSHDVIYTLDEPEIYMHPELCRCFINNINRLFHEHDEKQTAKSIQVIISTHSPFILSDILPSQVTRLKCLTNGYCEIVNGSEKPYFGANIHTIMADSFFLDYTIGEYARVTLQSMMDWLQEALPNANSLSYEEKEKLFRIKECVPSIGDSIIRKGFEIILEMFE